MENPQGRPLDVPELLQLILSFLPRDPLVRVRFVHSRWHEAVRLILRQRQITVTFEDHVVWGARPNGVFRMWLDSEHWVGTRRVLRYVPIGPARIPNTRRIPSCIKVESWNGQVKKEFAVALGDDWRSGDAAEPLAGSTLEGFPFFITSPETATPLDSPMIIPSDYSQWELSEGVVVRGVPANGISKIYGNNFAITYKGDVLKGIWLGAGWMTGDAKVFCEERNRLLQDALEEANIVPERGLPEIKEFLSRPNSHYRDMVAHLFVNICGNVAYEALNKFSTIYQTTIRSSAILDQMHTLNNDKRMVLREKYRRQLMDGWFRIPANSIALRLSGYRGCLENRDSAFTHVEEKLLEMFDPGKLQWTYSYDPM